MKQLFFTGLMVLALLGLAACAGEEGAKQEETRQNPRILAGL